MPGIKPAPLSREAPRPAWVTRLYTTRATRVVAALDVAAVLAGERVVALLVEQLPAAVERAAHAIRTEGRPQPELDGGSKVASSANCL